MVSQCIHIEYRSKNSWYNSVFTLNTSIFDPVYMKKYKLMKLKLMVSQCIHIEYRLKLMKYKLMKLKLMKLKLMVSQCIHIEYKSINSLDNSVFPLNTKVKLMKYKLMKYKLMKYKLMKYKLMKYKLMKYKLMKYKLMKLKLMVSLCIHIEYRSKYSWYNSVFTLST
ncbi:hypothetical protein OUZ56_033792, partial [Daphnia magna]